MASREACLGVLFSVLCSLGQLGLSIFTPLFLDSLDPSGTILYNVTGNITNGTGFLPDLPSEPAWTNIDPFFGIWISMGFDTLVLGLTVLILKTCTGCITQRETSFPKSVMLSSGACQAVSALLYQFSTSGSRTPPFLQGALGYFYIPIAFFLRFLILRVRPSNLKVLCAVVVVVAEFVSLIPTIFPQLESPDARQQEGGATGIARVLWPLCFVSSGIPHALWNILLETGVKAKRATFAQETDFRRLNIAYVMFWNFFGTFAMTLCLFWIDLIPGFGLLPDIRLMPKQLLFNIKCLFGATEVCGLHQVLTGWGRIVAKTTMFVSAGLLLRYGEGANFYAILRSLQTPLLFLFFTVFREQPFAWRPHTTLSTWLSLAAFVVMVPTVILYNRAAPERRVGKTNGSVDSADDDITHDVTDHDDERPLLDAAVDEQNTGPLPAVGQGRTQPTC